MRAKGIVLGVYAGIVATPLVLKGAFTVAGGGLGGGMVVMIAVKIMALLLLVAAIGGSVVGALELWLDPGTRTLGGYAATGASLVATVGIGWILLRLWSPM